MLKTARPSGERFSRSASGCDLLLASTLQGVWVCSHQPLVKQERALMLRGLAAILELRRDLLPTHAKPVGGAD